MKNVKYLKINVCLHEQEVEEEESSDDESVGEEQVMVETKLDSGNYDLHETAALRRRREDEMREVKAAMERENSGKVWFLILSIKYLGCLSEILLVCFFLSIISRVLSLFWFLFR